MDHMFPTKCRAKDRNKVGVVRSNQMLNIHRPIVFAQNILSRDDVKHTSLYIPVTSLYLDNHTTYFWGEILANPSHEPNRNVTPFVEGWVSGTMG